MRAHISHRIRMALNEYFGRQVDILMVTVLFVKIEIIISPHSFARLKFIHHSFNIPALCMNMKSFLFPIYYALNSTSSLSHISLCIYTKYLILSYTIIIRKLKCLKPF